MVENFAKNFFTTPRSREPPKGIRGNSSRKNSFAPGRESLSGKENEIGIPRIHRAKSVDHAWRLQTKKNTQQNIRRNSAIGEALQL